jgi:hypothetical protein
MTSRHVALFGLVSSVTFASAAQGQVPEPRPSGRISFFVNAARRDGAGTSAGSTEAITSVAYGLFEREARGLEYSVDFRQWQPFDARSRSGRLSVYDGYAGVVLAGGSLRMRGGQMWLTDLGALGSVAGGLTEFRTRKRNAIGRVRIGAFGGIEPDGYDIGYVRDLWKAGAYTVVEGGAGRRHVAGYIRLTHGGLVERSVATFSNFVPWRSRVFVYQVGEYDFSGPGGEGRGGLSYFFINARVKAHERLELQALFNRGRSVDARTITSDLLHGRAVSATALDGYLHESAGGRVTLTLGHGIRAYGSYTRDKNNRDSASTRRVSFGGSAQNVLGTGVDITVSDSKIIRPTGDYHSIYASLGRQFGRTVYLSVDYTSAVSIIRYTRLDGFTIEMRPSTTQIGGSSTIILTRTFSIFATATTTTDDDSREHRALMGMTVRLR